MAAVLSEIRLEGLGHELLLEWAPWARDDNEGGHSWSVKPRVDPGYHGDPPPNFFIVDKIVAPHRRDRTTHWKAVSGFYLGERALWEIADTIGPSWSDQDVMTSIVQFGALVEREWRDYTEQRRVSSYRGR